MTGLRSQLLRRRAAFAALIALALAMKALIPAGYMPEYAGGRLTLALCSGVAVEAPAATMPGMDHRGHDGHDPARHELPCPFAAAAVPAIGGSDPFTLAAPIALVVPLLFLLPALPPVARRRHLRPPLRGPPSPC